MVPPRGPRRRSGIAIIPHEPANSDRVHEHKSLKDRRPTRRRLRPSPGLVLARAWPPWGGAYRVGGGAVIGAAAGALVEAGVVW